MGHCSVQLAAAHTAPTQHCCSARALQAPAEDSLDGAQRALQASETLNGAQRALEAADHHLNRAMDDRTAFAAARRALNEARRLADAAMAQTSQQSHGRHGSDCAEPPAAAGEHTLRAAHVITTCRHLQSRICSAFFARRNVVLKHSLYGTLAA